MLFEAVFWGGFGLIFGSFANVLILRHDERALTGRSACRNCGTTLQWFELVPILSWVALRGRCRTCSSRISIQYPLVEALTALGFLLVGFAPASLLVRILGCAIIVLFIVIATYDLYTMIMPDRWVFGFGALAILSSAYTFLPSVGGSEWVPLLTMLIGGPLVSLPLFCMWYFSRGAWMGFGDVKFALGMGWLLGAPYGLLALMYSFVLGGIIGAFLLLLPYVSSFVRRIGITSFQEGTAGFTMKSEVPFGPFLILGTSIIWLSILYSYEPALTLLGDLVL